MDPTFDRDGYPTEATLERIECADPADALDLARVAWHWPDIVRETLSAPELAIVLVGESLKVGHRFVRFATGGWSGNESVITALRRNRLAWLTTWRLSARGGLYIFEYPKERDREPAAVSTTIAGGDP